MSLLGSPQNVLDVQQGLWGLAIQNSQPSVGFKNCLAYTSLEDIFCWIPVVCLTPENPTLHIHMMVLIQTQEGPYVYFWISFWVTSLSCGTLPCNSSDVGLCEHFISSIQWNWKALLGLPPPCSIFQRMPLDRKLMMSLTSFAYLPSWSIIP